MMKYKTTSIILATMVLVLSVFVRLPAMAQTSQTEPSSTTPTSGDNATATATNVTAASVAAMAATDPKMAATFYDAYLDDQRMVESLINVLKGQQGPFNVRLSSALNATIDNASSIGQIRASSVPILKSAFSQIIKDFAPTTNPLIRIYNNICGPSGIVKTQLKDDSEARRWAINACGTPNNVVSTLLNGIGSGSGATISSTDLFNMSRDRLNEQRNGTALGLIAYGLGLKEGASQGVNLGIDGTTLGAEVKSASWWKKAIGIVRDYGPAALTIIKAVAAG
jgi:hypothetical protein